MITIANARQSAVEAMLQLGVWILLSPAVRNEIFTIHEELLTDRLSPWVIAFKQNIVPEFMGTERCVYVVTVYGIRDGRWWNVLPVKMDVFVDRATGRALCAMPDGRTGHMF